MDNVNVQGQMQPQAPQAPQQPVQQPVQQQQMMQQPQQMQQPVQQPTQQVPQQPKQQEQPKQEKPKVRTPDALDSPELEVELFENKNKESNVDFDSVIKEHSEAIDRGTREYKNLDKMPLNIPLSSQEDISSMYTDAITKAQDKLAEQMDDMLSDVSTISNSMEHFTAANTLLTDSFKAVGENINDKLKPSIQGIGDSEATVFNKYKGKKVVDLDGSTGLMAMTALTGGMRRVTLWNSGIYITLRNIPLDLLNAFYREMNHTDYEYGKQYGGFYYLFADLTITEYIINNLLPIVICGSNYTHWKDMEKLQQVISYQDFPVILWAMSVMMHPSGTNVNFVCGDPDCRHIENELVDLSKLRLVNTDLINDNMIEHFKIPGWISDEQLETFRQHLNLNRPITFEYSDGRLNKKWKVNMKQSTLFDHVAIGHDYNSELTKRCSPKNELEVTMYTTYNHLRCYKPWIESLELTVEHGGEEQTFIVKNDGTDENDKTVFMLLDEFQANYPDFGTLVKQYILETKISHIAYYFPECPKCKKEPHNGYKGYVPYDPMQSFFTLALMKLLRGASKPDSKTTSKSTANS